MSAVLELDKDVRGLDLLSPDALYEVIDGEAKEIPPMGLKANRVALQVAIALARFVRSPRDDISMEGLFVLPAPVNRRRRPDVAYVPADRVPASWPPPGDEDPPAMEAVPSLVVEVVSPTDYVIELEQKRREYFAVGVTTVLHVFPSLRSIHVYSSPNASRILTEADTLEVGDALPGFHVPVAELFAPLNRPS